MATIQKIERLASDLLVKSGTTSSRNIYTNVDKIAQSLGIKVLSEDLGNVDGVLYIQNGEGIIGVNSKHEVDGRHTNRSRFTIAHEIGHFVLHKYEKSVFIDDSGFRTGFRRDSNSSLGEYQLEREANAFAAALLMPKDRLRAELEKTSFYFDLMGRETKQIEVLAKKFRVSEQAMTYRLANLELFHF